MFRSFEEDKIFEILCSILENGIFGIIAQASDFPKLALQNCKSDMNTPLNDRNIFLLLFSNVYCILKFNLGDVGNWRAKTLKLGGFEQF